MDICRISYVGACKNGCGQFFPLLPLALDRADVGLKIFRSRLRPVLSETNRSTGATAGAHWENRAGEREVSSLGTVERSGHPVAHNLNGRTLGKMPACGPRAVIRLSISDINLATPVPGMGIVRKKDAGVPNPAVVFDDAFVDTAQNIRVSPGPELLQIGDTRIPGRGPVILDFFLGSDEGNIRIKLPLCAIQLLQITLENFQSSFVAFLEEVRLGYKRQQVDLVRLHIDAGGDVMINPFILSSLDASESKGVQTVQIAGHQIEVPCEIFNSFIVVFIEARIDRPQQPVGRCVRRIDPDCLFGCAHRPAEIVISCHAPGWPLYIDQPLAYTGIG